MKKTGVIGIVLVVLLVIIIAAGVGTYNSLQKLDETTNSQWAQVENQLQRRYDLIPNLVETVKGYAAFEQETLTAVVEARNKFATATTVGEVSEADSELTAAMRQLSVVVEAYPDLKANQTFQDLMTQLEGTENRIAVARMDYNDSVEILNRKIRTFPTSIIAGLIGIEKREYFEASEGSEEVPEVDFGK